MDPTAVLCFNSRHLPTVSSCTFYLQHLTSGNCACSFSITFKILYCILSMNYGIILCLSVSLHMSVVRMTLQPSYSFLIILIVE